MSTIMEEVYQRLQGLGTRAENLSSASGELKENTELLQSLDKTIHKNKDLNPILKTLDNTKQNVKAFGEYISKSWDEATHPLNKSIKSIPAKAICEVAAVGTVVANSLITLSVGSESCLPTGIVKNSKLFNAASSALKSFNDTRDKYRIKKDSDKSSSPSEEKKKLSIKEAFYGKLVDLSDGLVHLHEMKNSFLSSNLANQGAAIAAGAITVGGLGVVTGGAAYGVVGGVAAYQIGTGAAAVNRRQVLRDAYAHTNAIEQTRTDLAKIPNISAFKKLNVNLDKNLAYPRQSEIEPEKKSLISKAKDAAVKILPGKLVNQIIPAISQGVTGAFNPIGTALSAGMHAISFAKDVNEKVKDKEGKEKLIAETSAKREALGLPKFKKGSRDYEIGQISLEEEAEKRTVQRFITDKKLMALLTAENLSPQSQKKLQKAFDEQKQEFKKELTAKDPLYKGYKIEEPKTPTEKFVSNIKGSIRTIGRYLHPIKPTKSYTDYNLSQKEKDDRATAVLEARQKIENTTKKVDLANIYQDVNQETLTKYENKENIRTMSNKIIADQKAREQERMDSEQRKTNAHIVAESMVSSIGEKQKAAKKEFEQQKEVQEQKEKQQVKLETENKTQTKSFFGRIFGETKKPVEEKPITVANSKAISKEEPVSKQPEVSSKSQVTSTSTTEQNSIHESSKPSVAVTQPKQETNSSSLLEKSAHKTEKRVKQALNSVSGMVKSMTGIETKKFEIKSLQEEKSGQQQHQEQQKTVQPEATLVTNPEKSAPARRESFELSPKSTTVPSSDPATVKTSVQATLEPELKNVSTPNIEISSSHGSEKRTTYSIPQNELTNTNITNQPKQETNSPSLLEKSAHKTEKRVKQALNTASGMVKSMTGIETKKFEIKSLQEEKSGQQQHQEQQKTVQPEATLVTNPEKSAPAKQESFEPSSKSTAAIPSNPATVKTSVTTPSEFKIKPSIAPSPNPEIEPSRTPQAIPSMTPSETRGSISSETNTQSNASSTRASIVKETPSPNVKNDIPSGTESTNTAEQKNKHPKTLSSMSHKVYKEVGLHLFRIKVPPREALEKQSKNAVKTPNTTQMNPRTAQKLSSQTHSK